MDTNHNELSLIDPKAIDEIFIGPIQWVDAPLASFMNQAQLQIRIVDRKSGQTIPGRITLTDNKGFLYPVHAEDGQLVALRKGVFYTGNAKAHLGLAPGSYRLYASRDFKYGGHRICQCRFSHGVRIHRLPGERCASSNACCDSSRHIVPP